MHGNNTPYMRQAEDGHAFHQFLYAVLPFMMDKNSLHESVQGLTVIITVERTHVALRLQYLERVAHLHLGCP